MFDTDRYADAGDWDGYRSFIEREGERGNVLVAFRPNFELFLLLHDVNAIGLLDEYETDLLLCRKSSETGKRFSETMVFDVLGFHPKEDENMVRCLARSFQAAVSSERKINQDINKASSALTSNLGHVVDRYTHSG